MTARGNRRQNIFLNDSDRETYLNMIKKTKVRSPFNLHAYCLMNNHVHLLLETIDHPPSKILHRLHLMYSKYFNRKYELQGHLFQGRYYGEIILNHHYFVSACNYIHRNPERANLNRFTNHPLWTSNCYHLHPTGEEGFITTELLDYLKPIYMKSQ
ncbi:transposase [Halobacillus trueperi]|uniref:transposase n=1 Tax=Halobacillus trueperi TaxID=156205 RepID=UPI003CC5561E